MQLAGDRVDSKIAIEHILCPDYVQSQDFPLKSQVYLQGRILRDMSTMHVSLRRYVRAPLTKNAASRSIQQICHL